MGTCLVELKKLSTIVAEVKVVLGFIGRGYGGLRRRTISDVLEERYV